MSDVLADLNRSLNRIAAGIASKMNERQGYLDKADEVERVYQRLLRDKNQVKGYRDDVRSFSGNTYGGFQGDNFKYKYKPAVQDLADSYDQMIGRIDTNLDALNNKVMEYRNKAAGCLGPLGALESAYHSVKTQIENWTN